MLYSAMAEDAHKQQQPYDPLLIARALDLEISKQADVMEAMNAVCTRLGTALTRWIGADGWQALLRRAVAETARPNGGSLSLDELGELRWTDPLRANQARDTCIQVLETVVSLLGRFVGAELALRIAAEGFVRTVDMRAGGSDHG